MITTLNEPKKRLWIAKGQNKELIGTYTYQIYSAKTLQLINHTQRLKFDDGA